jgi:hypothetical protein
MREWLRQATVVAIALVPLFSAAWADNTKKPGSTNTMKVHDSAKPHRLVIQVDQNDAAIMNLALNNATNVIE